MRTVLGVGNCQVRGLVRCAASALGLRPVYLHPSKLREDYQGLQKALSKAEIVFAPRGQWFEQILEMVRSSERPKLPVIPAPRLYFSGFHPDLATPIKAAGKCPELPMGTANSAILLTAWQEGLGPEESLSLFRDEVYEALGYYGAYASATETLIQECRGTGIDVEPYISMWLKEGPFFHVPLHPKLIVVRDIALLMLRKVGLHDGEASTPLLEDHLATNVKWPVYPEIAQRLGLSGDYIFHPNNPGGETEGKLAPMDLHQFITRTFAGYRTAPPTLSDFARMRDPRFHSLGSLLKGNAARRDGFASDEWYESEAAEGVKVVCDEELLDRDADAA